MPNDDIGVALRVDRIVATLRRWARNAKEQGAHEAVLGLLVAADEIERTRAERDEARREVCLIIAGKCGKSSFVSADAIAEAQRRGWPCFPEVTQ